jgi:aspartate carbamoyltransferase catalytic subunit
MRSVIDILDLSVEEIDELVKTACDMIDNPAKYSECCRGKKIATLFFEPSTRTRLSFESAMIELGGSAIGFSDARNSSASKGETIADTARVVSCYVDIIAMRHPLEGAPLVAALNASIPVINAGDGGHAHPTQTLADLVTIYREKGRFNDLTIGFCGDLKYGRPVHSLINALSRYTGIKLVLISPDELKLPEYTKREVIEKNNIPYVETGDLESALPELDILYMTRVQEERFEDRSEYERLKGCYVLDAEKLKKAKADMAILHPLPRVDEISVDVDADPRACYFKPVANGKNVRKALILKLITEAEKGIDKPFETVTLSDETVCPNARCISNSEHMLPRLAVCQKDGDGKRCAYCESALK